MELLDPLASGIAGAANGTVELYRRGTGVRASWYSDFEGHQTFSSGTDITLDGNGGAAVYVNELVDVVVRDANGVAVREFTAGSSAPDVEVRSVSFTGKDYDTAVSAAGNPTTLQAVLDLWLTSAGTTDFKVMFGGVATYLKNAVAGAQFYNVKDAVYGAKGDGATDDGTAIAAAITAAHAAGGGWVFFPAGTYRITATLSWPNDVNFIGTSPASLIYMDHATADILTPSASGTVPLLMIGMRFGHAQANSGKILNCTATARAVTCIRCEFGSGTNTQGTAIDDTGSHLELILMECRFAGRAAAMVVDDLRAYGCRFVPATWAGPTVSLVTVTDNLALSNCEFYPSAITAGTVTVVALGANCTATVAGCQFNAFGATVVGRCIDLGSASALAATGNSFGALGSSTSAVAFYNNSNVSLVESGNVWVDSATIGKPSMTPYTYTASTAHYSHLASRDGFRDTATQAGGGTKTLSTDLYGHIALDITDNTGFTLQLTKGVPGARCTLDLLGSNGAGTGAIAWGANVYGNPGGGFTIATTKHRMYSFKSVIIGGTVYWMLMATTFGDV